MKFRIFIVSFCLIIFTSLDSNAHTYSDVGKASASKLGELGVLKAEVFEDVGYVTRYEALKTILIAIGADDELSDQLYMYIDLNQEFYKIEHDDFEEIHTSTETITDKNFLYKYSCGYKDKINFAIYNGITKLEIIDGKKYFHYDREAYISEVITFMVRCLKGTEVTMEEAHQYAKELGLYKPEELYYNAFYNTCQKIDFDYFCVLMNRFINQKRYFYFDDNESFPKY